MTTSLHLVSSSSSSCPIPILSILSSSFWLYHDQIQVIHGSLYNFLPSYRQTENYHFNLVEKTFVGMNNSDQKNYIEFLQREKEQKQQKDKEEQEKGYDFTFKFTPDNTPIKKQKSSGGIRNKMGSGKRKRPDWSVTSKKSLDIKYRKQLFPCSSSSKKDKNQEQEEEEEEEEEKSEEIKEIKDSNDRIEPVEKVKIDSDTRVEKIIFKDSKAHNKVIRVILWNKRIYVRGYDIAMIENFENSSNFHRLFNKFSSPKDKLLICIPNLIQKKKNIYTPFLSIEGIKHLLNLRKWKINSHLKLYEEWMHSTFLPQLKKMEKE